MVSDNQRLAGSIIGGLLALILLIGVILYAADYGVEATIVDKRCPQITAETHIGGIQVDRRVTASQCSLVQRGDVVVYHIRSGEIEHSSGLFR